MNNRFEENNLKKFEKFEKFEKFKIQFKKFKIQFEKLKFYNNPQSSKYLKKNRTVQLSQWFLASSV